MRTQMVITPIVIAVILIIIIIIVIVSRKRSGQVPDEVFDDRPYSSNFEESDEALAELELRYVRGEIDEEEYKNVKEALEE